MCRLHFHDFFATMASIKIYANKSTNLKKTLEQHISETETFNNGRSDLLHVFLIAHYCQS